MKPPFVPSLSRPSRCFLALAAIAAAAWAAAPAGSASAAELPYAVGPAPTAPPPSSRAPFLPPASSGGGGKPSGAPSAPAVSAAYNLGSKATPFLQSKTLGTILEHEDRADPNCKSHQWKRVKVAEQPTADYNGKVLETKWVELWFFDRCGREIYYWVYFTEVGKIGAFVSLIDPK